MNRVPEKLEMGTQKLNNNNVEKNWFKNVEVENH